MKEIEKYISIILPLLGLFIGYPFYDEIIQHPFLRLFLYVIILYSAVIETINIIQLSFLGQGKSHYSLRVLRYIYIFACIGCFFVGFIVHLQESTVIITCRSFLEGVSEFSNGDLYELTEETCSISTTITNSSSRSIQIRVQDVVSLELLEFVPYDQLDIKDNYTCSIGADGLQTPIEFVYYIDTDSTIQNCESIFYNLEYVAHDAYYILHPNDIKELSVNMHLREEGYYKFRVSINYYEKGKKYTDILSEHECICKAGPFKKDLVHYQDLFERVMRGKLR